MPEDAFRMLICGPSNFGKTNILLYMLYTLLEFDKVLHFSKNLHQNKYQALLQDFAENIDPKVGYQVVEAFGEEIIPLEKLPPNNQKIVFDDLVCEKNKNGIINYFINERHRNCSVIYLTQTFYKVSKNIRDNCSQFCLFRFLPRENKRIADELWVKPDLLDRATDEKFSFYYDKPKKLMKKKFRQEGINPRRSNGVAERTAWNVFQKSRGCPPWPSWPSWPSWPARPTRGERRPWPSRHDRPARAPGPPGPHGP